LFQLSTIPALIIIIGYVLIEIFVHKVIHTLH